MHTGNAYLSFAERAAREACATLSPFTLASLDSAVGKAVTLALDTDPRRSGGGSNAQKQQQGGGGKRKTGEFGKTETAMTVGKTAASRSSSGYWGPYEDEVLYDLMRCGLYPLFASPEMMNNGESSLLRMAAELLQFANHMRHGRRALLAAHVTQFPPRRPPPLENTAAAAAVVPGAPAPLALPAPPGDVAGGGGGACDGSSDAHGGAGGDVVEGYVAAALAGTLSLAHTEALLVQSFDTACGLSQARYGTANSAAAAAASAAAAAGQAAAAAGAAARGAEGGAEAAPERGRGRSVTAGGRGAGAGGGGGEGEGEDGVLVLHTQDDLEYGMAYARVVGRWLRSRLAMCSVIVCSHANDETPWETGRVRALR